MASVNKVILLGHLGKDPETKNFENGGVVCQFSLATSDSYFDREKNARIDRPTEWHNIRINKPGLAKVAQQYLKKGSQVYLEGSIRTRSYEKDGQTRYITEIYVDDLVLTGGRPGADNHEGRTAEEAVPNVIPADDLPF